MAVPGGGELPDEAGEGLGEGDWFAAGAQQDVLAAGLDATAGEAADARGTELARRLPRLTSMCWPEATGGGTGGALAMA